MKNVHKHQLSSWRAGAVVVLCAIASALAQESTPAAKPTVEPLRVVVTIPDLGALARAVGGDLVTVDALVRGTEDPHFTVARPSLVRLLSRADMLVVVGLDLETAWLQPLCDNARNPSIQRTGASNTGTGFAGPGYIDASRAIVLRGVLADRLDRSLGDLHRGGNPHYLTDPLCGLNVAEFLRDQFSAVRPDGKAAFASNCTKFREQLCTAMVGERIARAYDFDAATLARLYELDRLDALLEENGDRDQLGGWFEAMRPYRGVQVIADHDLWPYFAARFGVRVRGFLEPKAGIAPTTRHLEEIVTLMQQEKIEVLWSTPYFSPQHAQFVAGKTGARIASLAHQVGARDGCDDFIAMVDHNVRALVAAIRGTGQ